MVRRHHVREHRREGRKVNDYMRGKAGSAGSHEGFGPSLRGGRSTELTTEQRNRLPEDAFAIPSTRAYPVPTPEQLRKAGGARPETSGERHALNALQRVDQHGTEYEKSKVRVLVKTRYPSIYTKWLGGR